MLAMILYNGKEIISNMKEEATQLVEDMKIYSQGLITSIEKGNIQESIEYVNKMQSHLANVNEYLVMKNTIQDD